MPAPSVAAVRRGRHLCRAVHPSDPRRPLERLPRHKGGEGRRGQSASPKQENFGDVLYSFPPTLADIHPQRRPIAQVFSYVGKWSVEAPSVYPGLENDYGLVLSSKAAHHAISAPLDEVFDPKGKPLVLSYEVKLQNGLDCGGAYIKLLSESDEVSTRGASGLFQEEGAFGHASVPRADITRCLQGIHAEEFSDKTP